jgi:hypothetical protein
MAGVEQGYLVIADISGYTSFMADTELAHSQEIMGNLLTLVLGSLTPTLQLMEIEGDAVFAYVPAQKLERGETLLEIIERSYVTFRDHIFDMQRATTCQCRACKGIPRLDLKFFTHFGEYAMQKVADRQKIVGSNVNLIHRLLKNSVTERTGWNAYAMFTTTALDQMKIEPHGMDVATENYEHLGDIPTANIDLKQRYTELTDARRVILEEEGADVVFETEYPVSPQVLWGWLHNPAKRGLWMEGTIWTVKERPEGRQGPGAVNHCAHDGGENLERVLDWRPFEYYTCEGKGGGITYRMTNRITPTANGCIARLACKVYFPLPGWISKPLGKFMFTKMFKMGQIVERLRELIESDAVATSESEELQGVPAVA